jgi:DNA-binding NtrC family response regulator
MVPAAVRILIVDDEPPLLKVMQNYLTRLGYQVETSTSADRAWGLVKADPEGFALILLDATMPGMSAEELAQKVLQLNPGIRLIVTSGYPVDLSNFHSGVSFLHKPFTPDMLADTVGRLLGSGTRGQGSGDQ